MGASQAHLTLRMTTLKRGALFCLFRRLGRRSGWAEVFALAFVRIELLLDGSLRFRLSAERLMCRELHIAEFADPEHRHVLDAPDDSKVSLGHEDSLRRPRSGSRPLNLSLQPCRKPQCHLAEPAGLPQPCRKSRCYLAEPAASGNGFRSSRLPMGAGKSRYGMMSTCSRVIDFSLPCYWFRHFS